MTEPRQEIKRQSRDGHFDEKTQREQKKETRGLCSTVISFDWVPLIRVI